MFSTGFGRRWRRRVINWRAVFVETSDASSMMTAPYCSEPRPVQFESPRKKMRLWTPSGQFQSFMGGLTRRLTTLPSLRVAHAGDEAAVEYATALESARQWRGAISVDVAAYRERMGWPVGGPVTRGRPASCLAAARERARAHGFGRAGR